MAEPIPKCFTFLIDVLRKSTSGSNKLHELIWDCKYDKKNGYAIKESESKRWLQLARSKIIDGVLDDAGFCYGTQPRIFLRTWVSKHVSGPIAEDVNRCILKLENHSGHLRYLIRRVKSGAGSNWEGEKLRRVIYYWHGREFEIIAELFELLKSIDFAMGWGTNKTHNPYWDGYEKHHRADEDGLGFQLNGTLTENDRSILIAMLDLKADKIQPRVSKEILGAVIFENEVGDSKRAFDNLSSLKLIESKRGPSGGYYLTEQGMAIAKDLKSRSG
jgi:hypothetical protein